MDIAKILAFQAQIYQDKPAIIFKDQPVTFSQLRDHVFKFANALIHLGAKKDDKVAIYLPNCPEYIYSYSAIWCCGMTAVPLDFMLTEEELISCLDHSDAKILITRSKSGINLENLKAKCPQLREIILCQDRISNFLSLKDLCKKSSNEHPAVTVDDHDYAIIFYTSGTTGRPKGVMLSYQSMLINQLSVINLLLNLLPPVSQINEPHKITNTLHKKLLSFVNEMVEPTKPLLKEKNGKRPVIAIQLSGPQLPKMPTITTVMVGDEVKAFAGMPPSPNLVISMDVGEEYRALSDQNVMGATLKGKIALVPFMIKRALKGQTKITGDKTLL
ncbi:MAG: acyl--CoA ligase, partial [Candidatus Omnitrophica bacterium]|nr:acyl--CoA ligase [Candidatus Omnitrophota bacterium]